MKHKLNIDIEHSVQALLGIVALNKGVGGRDKITRLNVSKTEEKVAASSLLVRHCVGCPCVARA